MCRLLWSRASSHLLQCKALKTEQRRGGAAREEEGGRWGRSRVVEGERERADDDDGGMGRIASLLVPIIRHREACRPVPRTRREAVVLDSLPPKEEGGPRLNDMWALLKSDSKDN
jgi:hypothetical protein